MRNMYAQYSVWKLLKGYTKQTDKIEIPNRIGYNIIIFSENYINVL